MKRFRPRARGRAGAIRKRTSHITIVVSRMEPERLVEVARKRSADDSRRAARRAARVRRSLGGEAPEVAAVEAEPVEVDVLEAPPVESTEVVETSEAAEVVETAETAEVVEAEATEAPVAEAEVTGEPAGEDSEGSEKN